MWLRTLDGGVPEASLRPEQSRLKLHYFHRTTYLARVCIAMLIAFDWSLAGSDNYSGANDSLILRARSHVTRRGDNRSPVRSVSLESAGKSFVFHLSCRKTTKCGGFQKHGIRARVASAHGVVLALPKQVSSGMYSVQRCLNRAPDAAASFRSVA